MHERTLRCATDADAAAIADIYAYYVRETTVSFELVPPDAREMRSRMAARAGIFPWLVCEADGTIAGYAYASRFAKRPAYDWSASVSIYIDKEQRRAGTGRALYAALHRLLTLQGIRTAYAGISMPNPSSEAFHTRMGYVRQGFFETAGYKFGRVAGVAWYAKALLPVVDNPPPPLRFDALDAAEVRAVLEQTAQTSVTFT